MAKAIPTLKIAIDFQDKGSQAVIEKLKNSLKQLELGASGAKPRIASLRKEILAQGNASVKSIANINAQSTALKALRDEAKIGGRAFNQLTKILPSLMPRWARVVRRLKAEVALGRQLKLLVLSFQAVFLVDLKGAFGRSRWRSARRSRGCICWCSDWRSAKSH